MQKLYKHYDIKILGIRQQSKRSEYLSTFLMLL
jgi:hypothetical protein